MQSKLIMAYHAHSRQRGNDVLCVAALNLQDIFLKCTINRLTGFTVVCYRQGTFSTYFPVGLGWYVQMDLSCFRNSVWGVSFIHCWGPRANPKISWLLKRLNRQFSVFEESATTCLLKSICSPACKRLQTVRNVSMTTGIGAPTHLINVCGGLHFSYIYFMYGLQHHCKKKSLKGITKEHWLIIWGFCVV